MEYKITVSVEDPFSRDAAQMMKELSEKLEAITGSSGAASFDPEDVKTARSAFVIARSQGGEPVGCGAIRPINEHMAEVKRMYAKNQGAGIGGLILSFLENKAQELGYDALRLETRLVNRGAVSFYEGRGYRRIPNYGKYVDRPEAVCFEKRIGSPDLNNLIYTIGHSNKPVENLTGLLKLNRITCVADVRSVPFSRFCPWFNRERLAKVLNEGGISYYFLGDLLGGRISDRDCYRNKTIPERKTNIAEAVDFEVLKNKPWFDAGIAKVRNLAASQVVAVMCSEEDPARCHRSLLISRRLMELGHKVLHIRGNGDVNEAEIVTEFDQTELEGIGDHGWEV